MQHAHKTLVSKRPNIFFSVIAFTALIAANTGFASESSDPGEQALTQGNSPTAMDLQRSSTPTGQVSSSSTSCPASSSFSAAAQYNLQGYRFNGSEVSDTQGNPIWYDRNLQLLVVVSKDTGEILRHITKDEGCSYLSNGALIPSSSLSSAASSSTDTQPASSNFTGRSPQHPSCAPQTKPAPIVIKRGLGTNNLYKTAAISRPNPITTCIAAPVGLATTYWAKEYGFTAKTPYVAGMLATTTTSGLLQYLAHDTKKPVDRYVLGSVVLQLIVDNVTYIGGQSLINYVWPAKTKAAKNEQTAQSDKVSEKPLITVPKAFTVQSLLKKNGTNSAAQ